MNAASRLFAGTLLAALLAADAQAQLEGTLFTQPNEREYLDYLRQEFLRNNAERGFDIQEVAIPEVPDDVASTPTGPTEFSFGGIMTRRDGSRSVWLNGRNLAESELPQGISLVSEGRNVTLRITHEGNVYMLRPGKTVDLTAGSVFENFQRPSPTVAVTTTSAAEPELAPSSDQETSAPTAQSDETADDLTSTSSEVDPLAAAVSELDDEEVDALFEAIERRRLERLEAEEDDEAPEIDEP